MGPSVPRPSYSGRARIRRSKSSVPTTAARQRGSLGSRAGLGFLLATHGLRALPGRDKATRRPEPQGALRCQPRCALHGSRRRFPTTHSHSPRTARGPLSLLLFVHIVLERSSLSGLDGETWRDLRAAPDCRASSEKRSLSQDWTPAAGRGIGAFLGEKSDPP